MLTDREPATPSRPFFPCSRARRSLASANGMMRLMPGDVVMSDVSVQSEVEQLRERIATLERLKETQARAVREQLTELQRRAEQLEQSEEALRRQTRILQAVLRSMGAGVVVAHESGRFLLF